MKKFLLALFCLMTFSLVYVVPKALARLPAKPEQIVKKYGLVQMREGLGVKSSGTFPSRDECEKSLISFPGNFCSRLD